MAENSKIREYRERIREVEHGDFNPLVFTCTGGMAHQCHLVLGWREYNKAIPWREMLNSPPIAAPATLANLRKLHPQGDNPAPVTHGPVCSRLNWVQTFSLNNSAESFIFTRALTSAVTEFACGRAPAFLKRYVESLPRSSAASACGDPIRRLVVKICVATSICVAGKEEISKLFWRCGTRSTFTPRLFE